MTFFNTNKIFETVGLYKILSILDEKHRKDENGITFALFEPGDLSQPTPYFYYFPNLDEALDVLVRDHEFEELFDDMVLDTAAKYAIDEDADYDSDEELTFLKSCKESDFQFFKEVSDEPTKITHKYHTTEYHFATEKDAQRFMKAVHERFFKLLQGAL